MSDPKTGTKEKHLPRREFLKGAAFTTGSAAAVALSGTQPAEAKEDAKGSQSGYRETRHIRTYYDLARF